MSDNHTKSYHWTAWTILFLSSMIVGTIVQLIGSRIGSVAETTSKVLLGFWMMVAGAVMSVISAIVFTRLRGGMPWWGLLAVLPVVGPFYIAYRYWHPRRQGDLICPKCDYDLRGSKQSTTCPECGEAIARPAAADARG